MTSTRVTQDLVDNHSAAFAHGREHFLFSDFHRHIAKIQKCSIKMFPLM